MLRNQGRRPVTLSWTNTTALAAAAAAKAALRRPSAAAAAAAPPAEVRGYSADFLLISLDLQYDDALVVGLTVWLHPASCCSSGNAASN